MDQPKEELVVVTVSVVVRVDEANRAQSRMQYAAVDGMTQARVLDTGERPITDQEFDRYRGVF